MQKIIPIILKILGFNSGQSVTNTVGGIVNYTWFIPVMGWTYLHRFDSINIYAQITHNGKTEIYQILQTSFGFLSVVVIALLVYFEILRRSRNVIGTNINPS